MNEKKSKIIIFDFDGTIVDTANIILEAGQIYYPKLTAEKLRILFDFNVFEAIYKLFNIDAILHMISFDSHDFFLEYQRRLKKKYLHAGMKVVLANLSKDYTLVMASSMNSLIIKKYLKKHNIKFFKTVLGSDTHFNKADNILILLKQYKVLPKNALLITDTLGDMKQATKVGVKSIAVDWGVHGMRRLRKGRPYAIVNTPERLHKKIDLFFS